MADINNMFPSKYLKAADLQGREVKVIMNRIEFENIGEDDRKPVLYFSNAKKGFVLNKTNAKKIGQLYGPNTDNWENKEIILYPTEVDFRGDMVEAIRVRGPRMQPAPATPTTTHDEVNPPPNEFGEPDDSIPF